MFITEVSPWGSGSSPYMADWFELTNTGSTAVNITGWKMDDNSDSASLAVALNGVTSIAAGQSVVFVEGTAATATSFTSTWFGASPPPGFAIGFYEGSGVGLSTTSDAVNIFDASNAAVAGVTFGASDSTSPFQTFDNSRRRERCDLDAEHGRHQRRLRGRERHGRDRLTGNGRRQRHIGPRSSLRDPLADQRGRGIGRRPSTSSAAGAPWSERDEPVVNPSSKKARRLLAAGALALFVPLVAARSRRGDVVAGGRGHAVDRRLRGRALGQRNAPYAADWFELTNTGSTAVDITGWKMDDNSDSASLAVALNGVTSIAAGQSVVFIEGTAATATSFTSTWFGASPPAGFTIGYLQGSGVGLSTGGDAVNIFDATNAPVTGVTFGASDRRHRCSRSTTPRA